MIRKIFAYLKSKISFLLRGFLFPFEARKFLKDKNLFRSRKHLKRIIYFWNNTWSAQEEYLLGIFEELDRGNIEVVVECGSGLTTLLLGFYAVHRPEIKIYSLENNPEWFQRIKVCCDQFHLSNVQLIYAPIKAYADFDWYDISQFPEGVRPHLVVCDGPPGSTRGGRSGVFFCLQKHFYNRGTILLDDASRDGEKKDIAKWISIQPCLRVEILGVKKPYARISWGEGT